MSDGNKSGVWVCDPGPQFGDWDSYNLNVSSYQGQNITLRLENASADNWCNTWTCVDDIEFVL